MVVSANCLLTLSPREGHPREHFWNVHSKEFQPFIKSGFLRQILNAENDLRACLNPLSMIRNNNTSEYC